MAALVLISGVAAGGAAGLNLWVKDDHRASSEAIIPGSLPPTEQSNRPSPPIEPEQDLTTPAALLPPSGTTADLLGVLTTEREAELLQRVEQSIQQNPEWWTAHVAEAASGPIAYHPNIGLTEAEFAEFMAHATNPTIGVTEQVTLSSNLDLAGNLEINWSTSDGPGSVLIDPTTAALILPTGEPIDAVPWSNTQPDSFAGLTRGWEWEWADPSIENGALTGSGMLVSVQLGVRDRDGRVFFAARFATVSNGAVTDTVRASLLYDRP